MTRLRLGGLAIVGLLMAGAANAQTSTSLITLAQAETPLRGSKVKGNPGEIQYNPRFGTMMVSPAEREYVVALIYDYQTREISLSGTYDPRTGLPLREPAAAAAVTTIDLSVPIRGSRAQGNREEIQYNPRFGTLMSAAAEREFVAALIYDTQTREIILAGPYDPRTGKLLRNPDGSMAQGAPVPQYQMPDYTPPARGMHWQ